MSKCIIETCDESFTADVLQSELPVLLVFWEAKHLPSILWLTSIQKVAQTTGDRLRVVSFELSQTTEHRIAQRFMVKDVPTVVMIQDGKEVQRVAKIDPAGLRHAVASILDMVEPPQRFVAFDGKFANKEKCLARLRKARDAGELRNPLLALTDAAQPKPFVTPVECITNSITGSFSEAVGIPEALGYLIDHLFMNLAADRAVDFALDWIQSIPVGADLGAVPRDFCLWLIEDVRNGVLRYLERANPIYGMWIDTLVLHYREKDSRLAMVDEFVSLQKIHSKARISRQLHPSFPALLYATVSFSAMEPMDINLLLTSICDMHMKRLTLFAEKDKSVIYVDQRRVRSLVHLYFCTQQDSCDTEKNKTVMPSDDVNIKGGVSDSDADAAVRLTLQQLNCKKFFSNYFEVQASYLIQRMRQCAKLERA